MGRWTFQDGSPLYIPDPGEEGGASMLGHLAAGLGQTAEGAFNALMGAPVTPVMGGPDVSDVLNAAGAPARFVTAWGHSMDPAGYQGTTDPIDYILTGEKDRSSDLAHYGDLLADTMEAEGTIREGSALSKAVRKSGEAISDPLVIAALTEMAMRPAPRAPGLRDRRVEPPPRAKAGGSEAPGPATSPAPKPKPKPKTNYRQPPIEPEDAARFPSVPLDRDMASPGVFTTGGTKNLAAGAERPPRGATAARRASRHKTARELGRQEQLNEGVNAMRREQLAEGMDAVKKGQLEEGLEAAMTEFGLPSPRMVRQMVLDSAAETGASAKDLMTLLANLF